MSGDLVSEQCLERFYYFFCFGRGGVTEASEEADGKSDEDGDGE